MRAILKPLSALREAFLSCYFTFKYREEMARARKEIIEELAEFTRKNQQEVKEQLKHGDEILLSEWRKMNPRSQREVIKFYQTCTGYLYSLSYFNYFSPLAYGIRAELSRAAGERVLDYGGGIGSLCIMLAQQGKDATYYDVLGVTLKFAKWRFERRKLNVHVIEASEKDPLEGLYEAIVCLDVLEHLKNPELHLKRLANHLAPRGKLFITAAFASDASYPLHFPSQKTLDELLLDAGLLPRRNLWMGWTVGTHPR